MKTDGQTSTPAQLSPYGMGLSSGLLALVFSLLAGGAQAGSISFTDNFSLLNTEFGPYGALNPFGAVYNWVDTKTSRTPVGTQLNRFYAADYGTLDKVTIAFDSTITMEGGVRAEGRGGLNPEAEMSTKMTTEVGGVLEKRESFGDPVNRLSWGGFSNPSTPEWHELKCYGDTGAPAVCRAGGSTSHNLVESVVFDDAASLDWFLTDSEDGGFYFNYFNALTVRGACVRGNGTQHDCYSWHRSNWAGNITVTYEFTEFPDPDPDPDPPAPVPEPAPFVLLLSGALGLIARKQARVRQS